MFLIRKPSDMRVREVLASQENSGFSYPEVGVTRGRAPAGYRWNQERFELGRGSGAFARGQQTIREWRMFDIGWIRLCWPETVRAGSTVAVVARHFGFWSLNCCRVVYVIEEPRRYGFAYGTLAEHAETGEERFTVEWGAEDRVWYEVMAFSREKHVLARMAFPLSRTLQARFRRDSGQAMKKANG